MAQNWWESPNAATTTMELAPQAESRFQRQYQPSGIGPPQNHSVYKKRKWVPVPGYVYIDKFGKQHVTKWMREGIRLNRDGVPQGGSGSVYYDEQFVSREDAAGKAREYKENQERERLENQRRKIYTLPPIQKL